jgi:ElaB/YqjD/DUF883 family membrane-anchored ribosome-binding protein
MERISGESEIRGEGGVVESHMHMRGGARAGAEGDAGRGGGLAEDGWDRLGDLRQRAREIAGRTRGRVEEGLERAGAVLDRRHEAIAVIREHPLTAIGLAFSVGFVAAALTGRDDRNWVLERARRQLRGAVFAGLASVLTHELRAVVGAEDGFGDLVHSLVDSDDEELDDELEV